MSIPCSFSSKPSLCRSSVTSSLWIPWGRLVQNRCWFLISLVVNGPIILSCFFRREFRMNLAVQATILNILVRSNFPSRTLRNPLHAVAPLKSSLVILASAWLSGVRLVTMTVGHFSLTESHSGPCHHRLLSSTCPPRLPKSAGFSLVGTWRQVIPKCSCIFIALSATSCL